MIRPAALLAIILLGGTGAAESFQRGCACRGGPGYRLPTGKCASWAQHRKFEGRGGYPAGTSDERGLVCSSSAGEVGVEGPTHDHRSTERSRRKAEERQRTD